MSEFLSRRFADLAPYVPGEQPQDRRYIKLNTNESPFPPSPAVVEALSGDELERLNLYPDPDAKDATGAIAGYFGLDREQVLLGNGSDEILAFCFQAFCDASTPACFPDITYGFYKVFAGIYGVPTRVLPLDGDLRVRVGDYCPGGGTIFLANPNAPTGHALALSDIAAIARANPQNVVVVDEAYVDFGGESACKLLGEYRNLLVVQTMSKSRNLAGMRLGYALGAKELIDDLKQMKFSFNPYNVNRISLLAAAAAIGDEAYFARCVKDIQETRAFTLSALEARGFWVLPSSANFLFARPNRMGGEAYYLRLKERGILVRHFKQARIEDYVRITIGRQEEMEKLLQATDEIWEAI